MLEGLAVREVPPVPEPPLVPEVPTLPKGLVLLEELASFLMSFSLSDTTVQVHE